MPRLPWNASQIIPSKTPVEPGHDRTTYSFTGVENLQLDAFPDGRRIWRVRYRIYQSGKRKDRAITLGELKDVTPGRARALLTDIEQAVGAGRDPFDEADKARRAPDQTMTFSDLVLQWIEEHSKEKKRSWKQDVSLHGLHIATRPLGSLPAKAVGRQDLISALNDIRDGAGGAQANRVQGLISAVFTWAIDETILDSNPAFGIRKRATEVPRSPKISDETICKMWNEWDKLPTDVGDVLRLLLLTGQRCSEVCGMRLDELQGASRLWVLPGNVGRTKNDKAHSVPLSPTAWAIVERASLRARAGYVFPAREVDGCMNRHTPSHRFFDVAKKLRIERFRLHDLRHAVKTYLRGMGVPPDIADRVQGQISGLNRGVGYRYDHHEYQDEKRRALELWERRLLAIVNREPESGERWQP